MVLIFR